jgi:hypothetical protein
MENSGDLNSRGQGSKSEDSAEIIIKNVDETTAENIKKRISNAGIRKDIIKYR